MAAGLNGPHLLLHFIVAHSKLIAAVWTNHNLIFRRVPRKAMLGLGGRTVLGSGWPVPAHQPQVEANTFKVHHHGQGYAGHTSAAVGVVVMVVVTLSEIVHSHHLLLDLIVVYDAHVCVQSLHEPSTKVDILRTE